MKWPGVEFAPAINACQSIDRSTSNETTRDVMCWGGQTPAGGSDWEWCYGVYGGGWPVRKIVLLSRRKPQIQEGNYFTPGLKMGQDFFFYYSGSPDAIDVPDTGGSFTGATASEAVSFGENWTQPKPADGGVGVYRNTHDLPSALSRPL